MIIMKGSISDRITGIVPEFPNWEQVCSESDQHYIVDESEVPDGLIADPSAYTYEDGVFTYEPIVELSGAEDIEYLKQQLVDLQIKLENLS
jgi:hypothetical protein